MILNGVIAICGGRCTFAAFVLDGSLDFLLSLSLTVTTLWFTVFKPSMNHNKNIVALVL